MNLFSRNVEELLWATMEYLQDASKRIQGQFYKCCPTVRVCTLNNVTLVHLDSSSIRMTTETMLRRMFEFDRCIDVTFKWLIWLIVDTVYLIFDIVDVKYTWFSNIASEDAICDIFNENQLVDCELLTLVFKSMKKTM